MATSRPHYTTALERAGETEQRAGSVLQQAYDLLREEDPADPEAQALLDDIRDFGRSCLKHRQEGNHDAADADRAQIGRRLVQYRALEEWDRKPSKGSWAEQALPAAAGAAAEVERRLPDTWQDDAAAYTAPTATY
ncbi:MAG: hypothetical protein SVW77_03005 [Candidatus Nanohaloarchaea archaeon]|nr:hypothetical protein [Candidatus Nanohaloarchaea archaeon]